MFNRWDGLSILFVFALFALIAWGSQEMTLPYQIGEQLTISLDPTYLPGYALRTVIRMFIALGFSLLATLLIAPLAAKNKKAERIILPLIDILQSVPVLGILSITVLGFIQLFPGSLLGPEFAAIFAIFTSQVWNMIFGFYQSLKTIPKDFYDTARIFRLSYFRCFIRIEIPFAFPNLLWNTMISLSAGWFFVVASEAISVANQNILLPGIGSYIYVAILNSDLTAIFYAIFTMFIIILLYDQLIFRPLLILSERYKVLEGEQSAYHRSFIYDLFTKTHFFHFILAVFQKIIDYQKGFFKAFFQKIARKITQTMPEKTRTKISHTLTDWTRSTLFKRTLSFVSDFFWEGLFYIGSILLITFLAIFIIQNITWPEIAHVFWVGLVSAFKIAILIILASLIWIPIGVWIGLNPRLRSVCQPLIQFLAAFPVNLVYPLWVTLIVSWNLNIEIWSAPLMILGTQWYILFNVIAGAATIPNDLRLTIQSYHVHGWLKWKRLILPTIFPYYITGAMTATGGCWNASVVSDVLIWGKHKLVATGLGGYIAEVTSLGAFPQIALGLSVMSFFVLFFNRFVWQKLFNMAQTRYTLE